MNYETEIINNLKKDGAKYENSLMIPKKIASLEVLARLEKLKLVTLVNIPASMIMLLLYMFSPFVAFMGVICLAVFNAYFYKKTKDDIDFLKSKYKI